MAETPDDRPAATPSDARSAFLAGLSHQLRTPLAAIVGYAELGAEDLDDGELRLVRDDLARIGLAGRALLELVSELVDLARLDAGSLPVALEAVDLVPIADALVEELGPLGAAHGNAIAVYVGDNVVPVHGDPGRVRQIATELVRNACRFTEKGSVSIVIESDDGPAGWSIAFRVIDTGAGIRPDRFASLFVPWGGDPRRTRGPEEGPGLGLALSRALARRMDGDVRVETSPRGTTATLLLPALVVQARPVAAEPAVAAAPADRRGDAVGGEEVLVALADSAQRQLAQRYLAPEGFTVILADGGRDALDRARRGHPTAIVADPDLDADGQKLADALRKRSRLSAIPVVWVSDRPVPGGGPRIPRGFHREALVEAVRAHRAGASGSRVLVVQAAGRARDALAAGLEVSGYEVAVAQSAAAAVEHLEGHRADLLVVDTDLRGLDLLPFLATLWQNVRWRALRVVLVSDDEIDELERRRMGRAVSGAVAAQRRPEPVVVDEVVAAVREALPITPPSPGDTLVPEPKGEPKPAAHDAPNADGTGDGPPTKRRRSLVRGPR